MERILEATVAILSILGTLLIGAISPGPSFVLVARTAVAASRRDGLAAALGMGVGGVVFGGLALLGLSAVLTQVPWLYAGFKLLGGLYLAYLAVRLWRGAARPIAAGLREV
jgi:threonine/homoserine/homoserine lactone efflux protein